MKSFKLLSGFVAVVMFSYAITSITGCRDCADCCGYKPLFLIDYRVRDYFFNSGSFWVYEEVTTLHTDSQYLYQRVDSISKDDERCGQVSIEKKFFYMVSIKNSSIDSFFLISLANTKNTGYLYLTDRIDYPSGYTILKLDMAPNQTEYVFKYLGKLSTTTINGNVFTDVMMFKILDASNPTCTEIPYPTEFWISPNVGIVKKIIDDPNGTQTWNLKRWSVTQ